MSVFKNKLRLAYSRERETQERKRFHEAFNSWLSQATESDFAKLAAMRQRMAPGRPCSMFKLVRQSLNGSNPAYANALPLSLRELLQARCWPRADRAAPAP